MSQRKPSTLSSLEYHLLLALADGPRYGYAIQQAIEEESDGAVAPRAGSLYRVIARLMSWRLVREARPRGAQGETHPGLERKYYALTPEGSRFLEREAHRLRRATDLAARRLGLADGPESSA